MPERWWFVVTSYPCPECTAGPGDYCLTKSGNRKSEPHAARSRLASENDWKEPNP